METPHRKIILNVFKRPGHSGDADPCRGRITDACLYSPKITVYIHSHTLRGHVPGIENHQTAAAFRRTDEKCMIIRSILEKPESYLGIITNKAGNTQLRMKVVFQNGR